VTLFGLIVYEGRPLGGVTGMFATLVSVIGFQILNLGLCAKTYSWSRRFDKKNTFLARFYNYFNFI
jgi:hypothetical protein